MFAEFSMFCFRRFADMFVPTLRTFGSPSDVTGSIEKLTALEMMKQCWDGCSAVV